MVDTCISHGRLPGRLAGLPPAFFGLKARYVTALYVLFVRDLPMRDLIPPQCPLPRDFTEASGASRSKIARQRSRACQPFSGRDSLTTDRECFVISMFLPAQEHETAASAQEAAVVRASSLQPRTGFPQSAAQLEPLAPCAPNSNRCQSVGPGRQLVSVRMS